MKLFSTTIYLLLLLFIHLSHAKSLHRSHQSPLFSHIHENSHSKLNNNHLRNHKNIEAKVLLQQSDPAIQAKIDRLYTGALDSLKSLQKEQEKQLNQAEVRISQMMTNQATSTMENMSAQAQAVFKRAQDEEETNKKLMNTAYQVLTKMALKIMEEEKEVSDDLKDSRVMLLQDKLAKLQEKFDTINTKFESFQQNLIRMKSKCKDFMDCGACTVNPGCGWCVSANKCIDGTQVGPSYESCSFYSYNLCTGSGCSYHKDCTSCINNPQCGWCAQMVGDDSQRCLQQEANYAGCPARQWYHSQGPKDVCDPEPKAFFDLNTAETLEALGYEPENNTQNPEDMTIEEAEEQFTELQAESEALRDRLTGIQEELKVIALDRFPPEQTEEEKELAREKEQLEAACATLVEPSPEEELDKIFQDAAESNVA